MSASSRSPTKATRTMSRVPICDPPSDLCKERRTVDQIEADEDLDLIFSVLTPVGYTAFNRSEGYIQGAQDGSPKLRARLKYLLRIYEREEEPSPSEAKEKDNKKRQRDEEDNEYGGSEDKKKRSVAFKENRSPRLHSCLKSLPSNESRLWAARHLRHARHELYEQLDTMAFERALEQKRQSHDQLQTYEQDSDSIEGDQAPPSP